MSTKEKKKTDAESVWIAELERFDYTLIAVGRTEEEATKAILKEYCESFQKRNGEDPKKEIAIAYGYDDTTYYDIAKQEVYCRQLKFGDVEWR